ncbi:MarR family winged helix-turn-helix transcriptional regulator [Lysinibacillus sphaericus]|uniref:Regulatory protein MarR n=1 Tax=Lysinibacillus sphaericus OT4b.31 TaxID=1285586 RepID=R7ZEG9_LYSSH|nr:MarR family transcriptional regulator [Lysinibacillus sphaericus]EON72419.1 regulatory protein MarR [Lysinibacillus sphaericus OT4b.31]
MDKKSLFNQFVTFTTAVHEVTHDLTQNVNIDTVTPVQYKILEYIKVSQPVTPTEISDCQHMSLPNTSRELKKLLEKNLIQKITDTEDRRKQYICLTNDGENMMNEAFACVEARFQQLMQNVSEEDLAEIHHALNVLQSKVFNRQK